MDKNINTTPKVSVLMPVYNGGPFVREAITSILNQTYTNFELIIINNDSTDNSASVISSIHDPRIRLEHNTKNVGLVPVRNQTLALARGSYIALLDADDVALPKRLATQVAFLDNNPSFGLVGTWTKLIDLQGKSLGIKWTNKIESEKLPSVLLFQNCFTQSSLMLRREALPKNGYRQEMELAEDYDLFIRISRKWKCWNIPKILTLYRKHPGGVTKREVGRNRLAIEATVRDNLLKLDIHPTPEEYVLHRTNYGHDGTDIKDFLEKRERWLIRLREANLSKKIYNEDIFSEVLAKRWLISCSANSRGGYFVWKQFCRSPLVQLLSKRKNILELTKFAVKAVLRRDHLR